MIKDTITMTSKGTFTLPVSIRRDLKLQEAGEVLVITYDPVLKQAVLTKPQDFPALQTKLSKYTKKKPPLMNVDEYYQKMKGEEFE